MNLETIYNLFKTQDFFIDSLALKIDINAIEFTSLGKSEFYANLITVDQNTGEIVKLHQKNHIIFEQNGIKGYCYKKVEFGKEYIIFSLSSKYLGKYYFQGLNLNTIYTAYENFIKLYQNFLYIPYNIFILSTVNDIDIFTDFVISDSDFSLFVGEITSYNDNFTIYRNKGKITGLQHLTRGYKNNKLLYFKFYRKLLELSKRSSEFFDYYLNGLNITVDLMRFEYTLKNASQIRSFLGWSDRPLSLVNVLEHRHKGHKVLLPFIENKRHFVRKNDYHISNNDLFLINNFKLWRKNRLMIEKSKLLNRLNLSMLNSKDLDNLALKSLVTDNLSDYLNVDIYEAYFIDLYGSKRPLKLQKYITRKKSLLKKYFE